MHNQRQWRLLGLAAALCAGLAAAGPLAVPSHPVQAQEAARPDTATRSAPASEDLRSQADRLNWPSAWQPKVESRSGAASSDGVSAAAQSAGEPRAGPDFAGTPGIAVDTAPPQGIPSAPPPGTLPGAEGGDPAVAGSVDEEQGRPPADAQPQAPQQPAANGAPAQPAPEQTAPPAAPAGQPAPAAGSPAPAPGSPVTNGADPPKAPAAAEPAKLPAEIEQGIRRARGLASEIDALEKTVERVAERDEELVRQLPVIESLIGKAQRAADDLKPKLADVRSLVDKLGPAPAAEAPPEAQEVAAERARLNSVVAEIDGAIKTADLVQVRARQLAGRVQQMRQAIFTSSLLKRSRSPLSFAMWQELFDALPGAGRQVTAIAKGWSSAVERQLAAVIAVISLSLLLYGTLKWLSGRFLSRWFVTSGAEPPAFGSRMAAAGVYVPVRALPVVGAGSALYLGLQSLDLLYLQVGAVAVPILIAFVIYKVAGSIAKAYLQPQRPDWRIVDVDDHLATWLTRVIKWMALVFGIDLILREIVRVLYLPLPVSIAATFLVSVLLAALFAVVVRLRMPDTIRLGLAPLDIRSDLLKALAALVTLATLAAAIAGYVALAHFIATQVLATGSALMLLVLLYLADRAIASHPDLVAAPLPQGDGSSLAASGGVTVDPRRRAIASGIAIALDIVLALTAIPVLLLSFGFSHTEIVSLANRAVFGFEFGGVQISPVRIAMAIALFTALVVVTRMVQRWLGQSVLHPTRTDQGLGNSISTGVGYIGFGVAALAGVSYAGLDITNLAIVAGALSVGIGFGLQSIVNNFVSGLILLVERPIKVGDWIRVGENQGHVRRISVRSTEIETFDRASVIIPNSALITGTVLNLTHRNAMGRVTIPVGVSYSVDPDMVEKILLDAALSCPQVARHPAPFVAFENFGASSLEFALRAFVTDVNRSLSAQTHIRKEILAGFRAHGIEIPYPQQDLHLRDLDGVREVLGRAALERMRSSASATPRADGDGGTGAPGTSQSRAADIAQDVESPGPARPGRA